MLPVTSALRMRPRMQCGMLGESNSLSSTHFSHYAADANVHGVQCTRKVWVRDQQREKQRIRWATDTKLRVVWLLLAHMLPSNRF
jgi:hypothetical protein